MPCSSTKAGPDDPEGPARECTYEVSDLVVTILGVSRGPVPGRSPRYGVDSVSGSCSVAACNDFLFNKGLPMGPLTQSGEGCWCTFNGAAGSVTGQLYGVVIVRAGFLLYMWRVFL